MSRTLPIAPVWLMGLTNATFGMFGGLVAISLPEILAQRHVPEVRITAITFAVLSPAFWVFLICPFLDVRFTRRFYATVFAVLAAVLLAAGLYNLQHLAVMEWFLMLGFLSACITQNALGGWLATAIRHDQESTLSAWFNVSNIGSVGLIATFALSLLNHVPLALAAFVLSILLLLPLAIYPFIPVAPPDGRLASESFAAFFGDVVALLKKRDVLVALALFLAPSGSFALSNVLGGLGAEYHASEKMIAFAGGAGVAVAGVCASLVFPVFAKRMPLRPLYLTIGIVGACFTLSLLLLPHTPALFAVSMIGENAFQALAITASFAIVFEVVGQKNPLSATTFSLLTAASNLPIDYMTLVDGRGYAWRGIPGEFLTDAVLGLLACALLGLLLLWVQRRFGSTASAEVEA